MAGRGWTAPTWPTKYGGGGLTNEQAEILAEELKAHQLPPPLVGFGLTMIGPTLLHFGNEQQKAEHLPKICRGEVRWCQGYSEPGAGSDLASLQTRAVRDGDHFIINGSKIWTSSADQADWIFALVRTDPHARTKQEGITFILIDMESPGVSTRPIKLISGDSPFCETHFVDVRVPEINVVGEVGAGWKIAKALLGHERSMLADILEELSMSTDSQQSRTTLSELAKQHIGEVNGKIRDEVVRNRVAGIEMDAQAFSLTIRRTRDAAEAGQPPGPETSIFKVYGTELSQRRSELMVRILGPQALGWEGPGFDEFDLATTRTWLKSRTETIGGGTSEIQLNVIAKRVLGLPD